MLHLLWAILYIGLSVYLLVRLVRFINHINETHGTGMAFIMSLFLLGTCNAGSRSHVTNNNANAGKQNYLVADSFIVNLDFLNDVTVANNWLHKVKLHIIYGYDKTTNLPVPTNASAHAEGVSIGTNWETASVWVRPDSSGKKFQYTVIGNTEYKLFFNVTIASFTKTYTGDIAVPPFIKKSGT